MKAPVAFAGGLLLGASLMLIFARRYDVTTAVIPGRHPSAVFVRLDRLTGRTQVSRAAPDDLSVFDLPRVEPWSELQTWKLDAPAHAATNTFTFDEARGRKPDVFDQVATQMTAEAFLDLIPTNSPKLDLEPVTTNSP